METSQTTRGTLTPHIEKGGGGVVPDAVRYDPVAPPSQN